VLPGLVPDNPPLGQRPGEILDCVHAAGAPGGCGTTEFCRTCGAVHAILSALRGMESLEECRIVQVEGSALDLRVQGTPLEVEGQKFAVFSVEDISHEKRRRALERIFFHDILNTASVLKGFADILQDATPAEIGLVREHFGHYADRLVDEINAQRELAAAETDDLIVHLEPVNALALLRQLATVHGHHPAAKDRQIVVTPDSQSVTFLTDPTLLGRVLGNMLKNALEASAPGDTVTLSCARGGDRVAFSVHNPTYMPRKVQLQVFQRSFSTKGAGRGLGTYSMRLLSEQYLGGRVTFTSSPDDGTTFVAIYPITPVS
jgi:signal transduction histidine kinase